MDAVFTGVVCCWCVTFQHEINMVLLWITVYLLRVPFALFVAFSSTLCHSKEILYHQVWAWLAIPSGVKNAPT